ncbi:MAG: nucleotidyl transferase AbiEii/AbiGii toxin family protein [Crocinitomicaceae bacterium]|nr:nucleotidyl transferase AbiEii/AbiGii toxin family protein [Crocinitomicaceae bacterium]
MINRAATKKIAQALGELNASVVYVGVAMVSLYIDDLSAEDVRPTKDIDISLEITNLSELEKIRAQLINKGFVQSSEDHVICRFRYDDIKVDVMSTQAVGWAPANPWFGPGFKHLISFEIDGLEIKCLALPYFMATKLTAFYDRGSKDPRTSQDFEDIVYLLNYVTDLKEQILVSDQKVKTYLIECFKDILEDSAKQEAILGNLFYEDQDYRYKKIISLLTEIIHNS